MEKTLGFQPQFLIIAHNEKWRGSLLNLSTRFFIWFCLNATAPLYAHKIFREMKHYRIIMREPIESSTPDSSVFITDSSIALSEASFATVVWNFFAILKRLSSAVG